MFAHGRGSRSRRPRSAPGERSPVHRRAAGPASGFCPSSHRYTDQGHGYPSSGSPAPNTCGTAVGRWGARRGSHSCSSATSAVPPFTSGSRTAKLSPSRYMALTVPPDGNRSTASPPTAGTALRSGAGRGRRRWTADQDASASCSSMPFDRRIPTGVKRFPALRPRGRSLLRPIPTSARSQARKPQPAPFPRPRTVTYAENSQQLNTRPHQSNGPLPGWSWWVLSSRPTLKAPGNWRSIRRDDAHHLGCTY